MESESRSGSRGSGHDAREFALAKRIVEGETNTFVEPSNKCFSEFVHATNLPLAIGEGNFMMTRNLL
jgi:hypothetical protein